MARNRPVHVQTANTVLHYKFDEIAGGGHGTAPDNSGGSRFLSWAAPAPPPIRKFANSPLTRGRLFPKSTAFYGTRAGDAASIAALLGEWTTCAWIVPLSIGDQQTIWVYAASGETEATNYLGRMVITSAGRLNTFWETGAGVNVNATQSGGDPLQVGVPQCIAIRKRTAGGGQFYVDFAIGGVVVHTVGPVDNASGGTSSSWIFGRAESGVDPLHALIRSCSIYARALTDLELTQIAAKGAGSSGSGPEFDYMTQIASPFVHWWLNENASVQDSGPNGFHLRDNAAASRTPPIASAGGNGGVATGSQTLFTSGSPWYTADVGADVDPIAAIVRTKLLGPFTYAGWLALPAGINSKRGIGCFGEAGFEADSTRNFLLGAEITAARGLSFGWEKDLGVNQTIQAPDDTIRHHEGVAHVALVKRASVAYPGKWKAEIWIDEVKVAEGDNLDNGNGGEASVFLIGEWNTGPAYGVGFDDWILEDRDWTEDEIIAAAGVYEPPDPDVTAPTVTAISVGPGTPSSSRVIEVTDPGGLAGVIIFATLGNGEEEWVWNGVRFHPRYRNSSKSAIADGFRFQLERVGGWPEGTLTIEAKAFDMSGNEG